MSITLKQQKKNLDKMYSDIIKNEFNLPELKIIIENDEDLNTRFLIYGWYLDFSMSDRFTLKDFYDVLFQIHKLYQEAQFKLQKVDDIYGF